MTATSAQRTIDLLERTWATMAELCADLDEPGFATPTACPAWSVKDQLSHILGTERTLRGEPRPDIEVSGEHIRNPLGFFNEGWIASRRDRGGSMVLDEFRTVSSERVTGLRRMSPDELSAITPTPFGDMPLADFLQIRLFDSFSHEQDIRRALERPGGLDGEVAERALDFAGRNLPMVVGGRVRAPDGSCVTFRVDRPIARTWTVAVRGGRATLTQGEVGPTAQLEADADAFLCLVWGRRTAAEVEAAGRLGFSGDIDLARRVAARLAITP